MKNRKKRSASTIICAAVALFVSGGCRSSEKSVPVAAECAAYVVTIAHDGGRFGDAARYVAEPARCEGGVCFYPADAVALVRVPKDEWPLTFLLRYRTDTRHIVHVTMSTRAALSATFIGYQLNDGLPLAALNCTATPELSAAVQRAWYGDGKAATGATNGQIKLGLEWARGIIGASMTAWVESDGLELREPLDVRLNVVDAIETSEELARRRAR